MILTKSSSIITFLIHTIFKTTTKEKIFKNKKNKQQNQFII
jgi:hypothetical protein